MNNKPEIVLLSKQYLNDKIKEEKEQNNELKEKEEEIFKKNYSKSKTKLIEPKSTKNIKDNLRSSTLIKKIKKSNSLNISEEKRIGPNPQSPIPNPQSPNPQYIYF